MFALFFKIRKNANFKRGCFWFLIKENSAGLPNIPNMWKNIFLQKKNPARWLTTLYIFLGSLWILFSDTLVAFLFTDPEIITRVQTYKGWGYVIGSGILIYLVVSFIVADLRKAKISILENEELQQDLFDRLHQPMWQCNRQGHFIYGNRQWFQLTGFSPTGKTPIEWVEVIHRDDKPFCIDKFSKGLIEQKAFTLEYRITDKNKEYRWMFNSCIPQFEKSGDFKGFIGFLHDISEKKQLEEKYKYSSRRYGYLFDNNPHAMLVYDLQDLQIMEVNKAACLQYGYSEEEMLNMSITDLRPSSEIPAFMEHLSGPLPEYQRSSGWLHRRKDGSTFNAEIIGHSLPVMKNRKSRLVIINDITEQVLAFKTAKEGEQRFHSIFNYSPYAAVILDEHLRVMQINKSACKILGIDCKSPGIFQLLDIIAQNSLEQIISEIETLSQYKPVLGEADFIRIHGDIFRAQYHALSFQEAGKQKFFFSFIDIDDKHRMQVSLQESERINATLVSNLPGMAYRCRNDENWTMLFVSMGVEKFTGYKPSELMHNNFISFENIIHPDDKDYVRQSVQKAIDRKGKYEIQYRIITRSGEVKWVWEQAHGVFSSNDRLKYIEGFIIDITERVRAEELIKDQVSELKRVNAELERFSYTVSHDLRSPLVTIKGFLGLLREDIAEDNKTEVDESIMRIENATDKMHQLLEDLLQLSRIGRTINPYEKFSMTSVAEEAKELLFALINEKKCKVIIQENMPEVFADKSRIREIYQNLIENAVKFSNTDEIPLVEVFAVNRNGVDIFCVKDNGIGISKAYHEKVFGLFNKLDNSSSGTGVGLSLVKHITESHKGKIWVESDGYNSGTLFCFTLNTEN